MQIRMLTGMAGGDTLLPGDIIEKPDAVAEEWIAVGLAEEAPKPAVAAKAVREANQARAKAEAAASDAARDVAALRDQAVTLGEQLAGAAEALKAAEAAQAKAEKLQAAAEQQAFDLSQELIRSRASAANYAADRDALATKVAALEEEVRVLHERLEANVQTVTLTADTGAVQAAIAAVAEGGDQAATAPVASAAEG